MKVFVLLSLIGCALAQFPSSKYNQRPSYRPQQPTAFSSRPQTSQYVTRPPILVSSPQPQYFQKPLISPQKPNYDAQIISDYREVNPDGSFRYEFKTSDGTEAEAQGYEKPGATQEESIQEVKGSYKYIGDDGQTYVVQYIANEDGFQPSGSHLPTPPPIPEAILRSLEYNAKFQQAEQQSQYTKQPKYSNSGSDYYTQSRYTKK